MEGASSLHAPPTTAEKPVRISVSKVAAIAGLHPFADIAELFEEALYQDAALSAHDQATLGVSLRTEQELAAATVAHLSCSEVRRASSCSGRIAESR